MGLGAGGACRLALGSAGSGGRDEGGGGGRRGGAVSQVPTEPPRKNDTALMNMGVSGLAGPWVGSHICRIGWETGPFFSAQTQQQQSRQKK